ncbi:hypothetical protein HanPSC8_Chr01g0008241 [Helianthus annuus]|nr:hypothetical protein HanPSC8_Chr01g0008241 [Helianthus annuus]
MASSLKNTSTAMSAVNSSQGIPPLPPPPAGSQKNAEKRPTPIFSKPPSSSAPTSSAPSTSDMFTLILQMRDRIQRHDETNDRILKEIGDLKRQKKTAEDHSPLVPKSLNFDTPMITSQPSQIPDIQHVGGPRGVHFGSAIVTQASGSYFQPTGSYPQHMGSFVNSEAYSGAQQVQGSSFVSGIPPDARILEEFADRKFRCPSRRFYSNADHCFHWSLHPPRVPAIWIHIQYS